MPMIAQAWASPDLRAIPLACTVGESFADAAGGRFVVDAETGGIDEFALVDDPVDFLVFAGKAQERGQRRLFRFQRRHRLGKRFARGLPDLAAEVVHQRAEDFIL